MIIDSRESSVLCSNVEYFAGMARVPVERTFLEVGDYVDDEICIEAKSVNDFYYSVKGFVSIFGILAHFAGYHWIFFLDILIL